MAMNAVGRFDDISSKELIRPGSPAVYRLKPERKDIGTIVRWTFGTKDVRKLNKTILLVGETGSGKSTLINALVNYALGVKLEDNVWFEFVDENEEGSDSQTSDVVVYQLFGFEDRTMPFSLTLIDTPGFGDTRGDKRDELVSQRLLDLFSSDEGVHELSAVGLVLKSTVNRLDKRQKYIFNAVLSLFGKNMKNYIIPFVTHSNGMKPTEALRALKDANIKCAKDEKNRPIYFLFDNCQRKDREEEEEEEEEEDDEEEDLCIALNAAKITRKGMGQVTKFLEKTEPQRLQTTASVLIESIQLKACIENLKERVEFTERKQKELQKIKEALRKQKEAMQVRIEVAEIYKEKEGYNGEGRWWALWLNKKGTLSCKVCQENCHYNCTLTWTKELCKVIKGGRCTVCTGKCHVSDHEKGPWRYVTKTRKVSKTLKEITKKYKQEGAQMRNPLGILEDEVVELQKVKDQLLEEALQHVLKLKEIALESLITHDHLDFLIDKMKERGFEDKASKLEEIKTQQMKEQDD